MNRGLMFILVLGNLYPFVAGFGIGTASVRGYGYSE
jgi:hypothetical protein